MPESQPLSVAERASQLKNTVNIKRRDCIKADGLRLDDKAIQWWQDACLGMFIHWGLYSLLGRGEWAMHNEQIPANEYAQLSGQFRPDSFDASAWAQIAKNDGILRRFLTCSKVSILPVC